jgi:hypothetical protein
MTVQNCNLPDLNYDNTFPGIQFVLPENELYDLAYATAKIQFRKSVGSAVEFEFKPGNGSLIIEQPYTITIPEQIVPLKPGIYLWDLKIRFQDQREKTYVGGKWTINPVITSL